MKRFFLINKILFIASTLIVGFFHHALAYADAHALHHHAGHISAYTNRATMKLSVEKIVNRGEVKLVFIKLTHIKTNQAIRLHDLREVHTQKIHMLVIDDSLSDYSHVHPVATSEPGVYQFTWEPKKRDANYRIWADVVPEDSKQQEYLVADLFSMKKTSSIVVPAESMQSFVGGYKFNLHFEPSYLELGKAVMGKITVSDLKGRLVHNLEPVMGAYAHIVGFNADFKSVVHIHPQGVEPSKASDRGGPKLEFYVNPSQIGFIKLFAQVKIKGKEIFVPFGIVVNPKRFSPV